MTQNTVSVTAITSTPSVSGVLNVGAQVSFRLAVSQAVTISGSPRLTLSNNATATYDAAASTGTSLVFRYAVAAGQDTADLRVAGLNLNGGTVTVPSGLSFGALSTYAAGTNPLNATLADLNGDGYLDAVAADYTATGTVAVLLGNGHGGFGPATTYNADGVDPSRLVLADLNGDGKLDIVASNQDSGSVAVLLGNGSGGFGTVTTYAAGNGPEVTSIADIDGDGKLDLVAANAYGNDVAVMRGNGAGGFGAPTTYASGPSPYTAAFADINGDGRPDIVSTNYGDNTVSVLLNNGAGGFGQQATYAVGSGPFSLATADLNGDGKLDIVTANNSAGSVSVLLSNGMGGFRPATNYTTGPGSFGVKLTDLDGDGKLDIAVAVRATNAVAVLRGDGTGGFSSLTTFAGGSFPSSVTAADINGDNKPDLVLADLRGDAIGVLLNTSAPAGTFSSASVATAAGANTALAIDTTAPTITADTVGPASGTYGVGQQFSFTLATSEAVTVTGTPTLALNDGGTASYVSGSGSSSLVFTTTVAAGQNAAALAVTALSLTGGATIKDAAGNNAVLSGAAATFAGLAVDTIAPVVTAVTTPASGTFGTGQAISFTLATSEAVAVTGTPTLTLNDGGTASYVSGSGSSSLVFATTVAAGQNAATLAVTGVDLTGGATIRDAAGNDAGLGGAAVTFAGLAVDTTAPVVTAVTTPASGTFGTGQAISFTLATSKAVAVTGTPTLTLNDGGTASYVSGSGSSSLVFTTTVAAGQNAAALAVTGVDLTGGATIRDAAGNDAVLGGAMATFPGVSVDTTAPSVTAGLASDTGIDDTDGVTSSPALTGMAEAGGTVTVMNGAATLGTATVDPTGHWTFDPALADGAYTLTATEADAAGNLGTTTLAFTLDTAAPAVMAELASNGAANGFTASPALTGTAEAGGTVTVMNGSATLGTATVDPSGHWTFAPTLADGDYSLTASQTDTAGNVGATMVTFALDTAPPTTTDAAVTVTPGSSPAPIGIVAPSDTGTATQSLAVMATGLPANGSVTLGDGSPVTAGQILTAAQLTDLRFTPSPDSAGQASAFTYAVKDLAGNLATGRATLTVSAADAVQPPTFAGVQDTSTALQRATQPFATVTLADATPDAVDRLRIVLSGAAGALAGAGLTANADGSYALAAAPPATLQAQLNALTFTPALFNDGPLEETTFDLTLSSSSGTTATATAHTTVDSTPNRPAFGTTVVDIGSAAGQIYTLYDGLLGRTPDPAGFSDYVSALEGGASLHDLAQLMLDAPEFAGHFEDAASVSDKAFVDSLYQVGLGRAPDAGGEGDWLEALSQGRSRADVAIGIAFSAENAGQVSAALQEGAVVLDPATTDAARLYYGLLGRSPDAGGLDNYATSLHGGATLTDVAADMLQSAEYAGLHQTAESDAQFVEGLYGLALGRQPEQTGEQSWLDAMANGASRADVAVGITQSPEAHQHLAGQIETGWHLS